MTTPKLAQVAQEIHRRGRRAQRPFVRVNCSAIPREMFKSEFFGHLRGAFRLAKAHATHERDLLDTGALRDRFGRFQVADGGSIFLDEIGELPLDMQPKLLRVLQEGQYERVGEDVTRKVDVRVIAAKDQNLQEEARAHRFRQDLPYRVPGRTDRSHAAVRIPQRMKDPIASRPHGLRLPASDGRTVSPRQDDLTSCDLALQQQGPRDARRKALRIEMLAPAVVHWSLDGWRTAHDAMTRDTTLGVHVVDLATTHLFPGARIDLTFYWPEADRWEGTDYLICIE